MESFLIAVGALVPMLLILVVVHEWGHYATARKLGVKVLEFGVGFPPRAFGVYTGNTRVLTDENTIYIGLENDRESLRRGQFVKIASTEDENGNLVARLVEAPLTGLGLKDRIAGRSTISGRLGPDEWLRHEGKIRALDDGSLAVADMLYSVNWTPLGGFVRLAGENNPNVPRSLAAKGVGTRFLVLVAGPLMNAILPIAFFTILLMLPQEVEVGQVAVTKVESGSPAQTAGLRQGDIVTDAGGQRIRNDTDLHRAVNLNGGSPMEWGIDRSGTRQTVQVLPEFSRPEGRWLTGITISSEPGGVTVNGVNGGSPAEVAGLQPGDTVTSVNGQPIAVVGDLVEAVQLNGGSQMEWGLVRDGIDRNVVIVAEYQQAETEMWRTGAATSVINGSIERRSTPPWIAVRDSFVKTWEVLVLLKQAVVGAFAAGAAPQLSGPVGIAQITGEVTREGGLAGWITITILLSINLAILNILPIPMLDGGRLVFVVLEWLRRGKRVPPEKEGLVHLIGFVVLIGLIVVISANDIMRLVQGQSFLGG